MWCVTGNSVLKKADNVFIQLSLFLMHPVFRHPAHLQEQTWQILRNF